MSKRVSWLSLTPEPERELPVAVATLEHGGFPPDVRVREEQARIERLILRGSERDWLAYLRDVRELIERHPATQDEHVARARARATAVLSNHHNLLLGIPSGAAASTAAERVTLARLAEQLPLNQAIQEPA
jgi:hypothetical protein